LLALGVFVSVLLLQALPALAALADSDGDFIDDAADLCPAVADPFQGDIDGDGVGDLCDPDTVATGTDQSDLMIGTDGADALSGLGGNDALYGADGDDTLDGGEGDDFLAGGPGTDHLTGGAGCDVIAYDPMTDGDVVTDYDLESDRLLFPPQDEDPSDDVAPAASFGGDTHLVVTFTTDTTEANLEFEGLAPGIEIPINTSPCEPPPPPFVCSPIFEEEVFLDSFYLDAIPFPFDGIMLIGTDADETLVGTHCSDIIAGDTDGFMGPVGLPSDDVIYGLAGIDLLFGDRYVIDYGDEGGDDIIFGGDDTDAISGDSAVLQSGCGCGDEGPYGGDDFLYGEGADDILVGDAFELMLGYAEGGDDTLDGGQGEDLMLGDAYVLAEETRGGDDTITGGPGDDFISGDGYTLESEASGGMDVLSGGEGDDYIAGDGTEILDTARGNDDFITGGPGDDELYGDAEFLDGTAGTGWDTFFYDATADFGHDVIGDLQVGESDDTIQFDGVAGGIVGLDLRSTVSETSGNVLAVVFDATNTFEIGSIRMVGIADGSPIDSWADIILSTGVIVVVNP
jgi:Ca2+-binding RTX toxin-like protein